LTVITENADPSLVIQVWVGGNPCLVTITVARPDVVEGWPERQLNQKFTLQTVSGKAFHILKEFFSLTVGRRPLKICVFVANITNNLILGLDILRPYDASVDIGREMLRMAEEVISLWSPGAVPRPYSLVVAKNQVIPAQCEGMIMARLESHRSRKWSSRTKSAGPSSSRDLRIQNLGSSPSRGTSEGLK
jgi:hypothetical protein